MCQMFMQQAFLFEIKLAYAADLVSELSIISICWHIITFEKQFGKPD